MIQSLRHVLYAFGLEPHKTLRALASLPSYYRDLRALKQQRSGDAFPISSLYPCLTDKHDQSGAAKGHYFHQDLLVARRIFENRPERHVDVGSRIDGFVAHVASFRPIEVMDIRPLSSRLPNITFKQADMMSELPAELVAYTDSLSCLHTLEHFGLGRYGDPINYDGYRTGFKNLTRVLKVGGKLYLSTPIGRQRIEFNAHRVFAVSTLLDLAASYHVDAFSYVDDAGDLHENVTLDERIDNNYGCRYGCGIFELTKGPVTRAVP